MTGELLTAAELARCPTNEARYASLRIGHRQRILLCEVGRLPRPPPEFQGRAA